MIFHYFPEIVSRQIEQFEMMARVYAEWNKHINVISRKDIDFLYERHVLHSLAIAKVISFAKGAKVLDVGTGGGFPGIPLAILFPETRFNLIDSIGKKLKVVEAVIEKLQLQNVTTQHIRAENITEKYDFTVNRAVTSIPVFLTWMNNKFSDKNNHHLPNGTFFLKGGELDAEINSVCDRAIVYNISDFFNEPFFVEKKIVYVSNNLIER